MEDAIPGRYSGRTPPDGITASVWLTITDQTDARALATLGSPSTNARTSGPAMTHQFEDMDLAAGPLKY